LGKLDKRLPKNATDKVWWSFKNKFCSRRYLKVFLFSALLTPKRGNWNDMSKFKCDCHKDTTDQIWSKSAQLFQRRRWLLMHDARASPFDTYSSTWTFRSGELVKGHNFAKKNNNCNCLFKFVSLYENKGIYQVWREYLLHIFRKLTFNKKVNMHKKILTKFS
jgi:hypothetical protein